jgi:hypothetical protein
MNGKVLFDEAGVRQAGLGRYLEEKVQIGCSGEHLEEEDGQECDNVVLCCFDAIVDILHRFWGLLVQAHVPCLFLGSFLVILLRVGSCKSILKSLSGGNLPFTPDHHCAPCRDFPSLPRTLARRVSQGRCCKISRKFTRLAYGNPQEQKEMDYKLPIA